MFKLNLDTDDKQLVDSYKLIKNTTTIKNKNGETKKYISYNCSFPYSFIEMFNNPHNVYFYKKYNKIFITNTEPSKDYYYCKVSLQCRKTSRQKSSKENEGKQWAKLMTVPKKLMGELSEYLELNYILHINQKDYVSGKNALLEVFLT